MKFFTITLALLAMVSLTTGCSDNPTGPPAEEGLTFTLDTGVEEVETLTQVDFALTIRDGHGEMMTNYEELQLEQRLEGSTTWRAIPMTHDGSIFRGQHTFGTSGEYEVRVMGAEEHSDHAHGAGKFSTAQSEMRELHHFQEHLHIHRTHHEMSDHRIEFESFPGHVHEGEQATFMFWVEDAHSEHSHGEAEPTTGLDAEIHCTESDGTIHIMSASESAPGVYESDHTVEAPGMTKVALKFMSATSTPVVAEYQFEVAAGH